MALEVLKIIHEKIHKKFTFKIHGKIHEKSMFKIHEKNVNKCIIIDPQ